MSNDQRSASCHRAPDPEGLLVGTEESRDGMAEPLLNENEDVCGEEASKGQLVDHYVSDGVGAAAFNDRSRAQRRSSPTHTFEQDIILPVVECEFCHRGLLGGLC